MPKRRKPLDMRTEKVCRDVIRLEIAALLHLARTGKSHFAQDVLEKCTPEQRTWVKDEMKKLEQMLRTKAEAEDEA